MRRGAAKVGAIECGGFHVDEKIGLAEFRRGHVLVAQRTILHRLIDDDRLHAVALLAAPKRASFGALPYVLCCGFITASNKRAVQAKRDCGAHNLFAELQLSSL